MFNADIVVRARLVVLEHVAYSPFCVVEMRPLSFVTSLASLASLLFMAALRSRCGHYIFSLLFLLLLSIFFPRLISAVADLMSTIFPHMVWP